MLKRGMFRSHSVLLRCHLRRTLFEKHENTDNQPILDQIRIKSWILEELQRMRKGRIWFFLLTPTMLLPACLLSRQCTVKSVDIYLNSSLGISAFCCLRKPSEDSSDHFNRPLEIHFSAQNHVLRCLNIFQALGTWMSCAAHACGTLHLKSAIIFPKYIALWGKKQGTFSKLSDVHPRS